MEVLLMKAPAFRNTVARSLVAAAVFSLGCAPSAVQAQTGAPDAAKAPDPMEMYIAAGADADQEKKIRRLTDEWHKGADEKFRKIMQLIVKLHTLSRSPDLDEHEILDTQANISKLQTEMAMDKVHLLIDTRRVLTKTQRIKLVDLLQQQGKAAAAAADAEQK
jgi:Spy/CpxP family protein refolding chaperone